MKNKTFKVFLALSLISFTSCSQNEYSEKIIKEESIQNNEVIKTEPHRYGGWYCPDNLNGFPAVDIANWKNVRVVNGRMPTQEETQNGTSLIFVDTEKYPDAKPLDMKMPRLASYSFYSSKKEEIIIVIQAVNITNDSIVGFRYLNGGNGSARINEVRFLSDNEIEQISPSRFISFNINIKASQDEVFKVLTDREYSDALQPTFDKNNTLKSDWKKSSKVNFKYSNGTNVTSAFADKLYGNNYIQIDCKSDNNNYVEKFFLFENEESNITELNITCGPYGDDFENQKIVLHNWAEKVKELSEKITNFGYPNY